jgi:hypothetical protein
VVAITALIVMRGMVDAHAGKASVKTPDCIAQQSALAQRHDASGIAENEITARPLNDANRARMAALGQGTQPSPQPQAQPRHLGMSQ